MKPIGLQLYSLREQAKDDYIGVLKRVADMGYAGVEPAGLFDMDPREVRKVLDDLGMVCCSIHGPMPTAETINQRTDEAAALGTDMLISGLSPADYETPEATARSLDVLAEAAERVTAAGMTFGYHNHWWEFDPTDDGTMYETLLNRVGGMFSELDVYWAANFGTVDVPAVVAKHAARIPLLHIKDGPLVRDEPHTAVGAGKMDFAPIIAAADENVLQWLIVELDACATDMVQAVADSVKYLAGEGLGRART